MTVSKITITNILLSQPKPVNSERSPYFYLARKYNVEIDFIKFFRIERLTTREFREKKIYLHEYLSIIFTSRQSVDHYFSMAKDLRYTPPDIAKYFCMTETIALYLQKYIQFRKRKIFFAQNSISKLADLMKKHNKDTFLFPCSDEHNEIFTNFLRKKNFKIQESVFFRPVVENLKNLDLKKYNMIIFFSPFGIKSLKENFPDFKQGNTLIGGFGESTSQAIEGAGFVQNIFAPTEKFPSMVMAMDAYLMSINKKK